MKFLHFQVSAGPGEVVRVTIDNPANVYLLDTLSYQKYRMKKPFSGPGGYKATSPVDFRPSSKMNWHVIVDMEGLGGEVKAQVQVIT